MNVKLFIILLTTALVYGANIWGTSVYVLDEAKNSGCAMEMEHRNDLVVPTFNDKLRTDKPPLHYFFMRLSYKLFGISPFSARFFSVIMGVLTVLSLFLFTKAIFNIDVAFFSSLILISSVQMAIQFHLAVPDPYLIFLLTTSLLSFYYAFAYEQKIYFYLFYVGISLATLTKGPVAIIFSALIIIVFLACTLTLNLDNIKRLKLLQGILIFCVIVIPWYYLVGLRTEGAWLEQFFFKHNVERFTSSMEGHGGFPLASFVIVIVGLMPFSFFFPQMLKQMWKDKDEKPFLLFCFIAVMVVTIFFAFSRTILPTYPEPALPFFAILLGYFFQSALTTNVKRNDWVSALVYMIITLALPFVVWFALHQDKVLSDLSDLAIYFVVFPMGAIIGLYFFYRRNVRAGFYSYVTSIIAFMLIFFYVVFPQVDARNPVTKSISILKRSPGKIYFYKDFNPAYVMALKKTIPPLNMNDPQKGILVVSQKKYLKELETLGFKLIFEGQDLFERPVTVVVSRE